MQNGREYLTVDKCGSERREHERLARADEQDDSGRRHLAARRYDAAINYFTGAIKLNPTNADYYMGRGLSYASTRDYERATLDIGLNPEYAAAYNSRGLAYAMVGDYRSAIEDHDEALRLDPGYKRAGLGREASIILSGKYEFVPDDLARILRNCCMQERTCAC